MKITPKFGLDQLLFGMKQKDVSAIYGQPDKQLEDDDNNIIFVYNKQKMRLTFYEEEQFRLGYIISSNTDLQLFDKKIIDRNVDEIKFDIPNFKSWEIENFDMTENHFNEDSWLILVTEFGVVSKIELGAIINDKDEFDWKF